MVGRLRVVMVLAVLGGWVGGARGADVYVAVGGDDSAQGTRGAAVGSLERGRELARAARRGLAVSGAPAEGVTVWIRGGTYYLPATFELTGEDSGVAGAPTVYRSVPGTGEVRLVRGRRLEKGAMKVVTEVGALARMRPEVRGKVVGVDLAEVGVRDVKAFKDVFTDAGGLPGLYVDRRRLGVSRFPNEGNMTMKRVLDNAGGPTTRAGNDSPDWGRKGTGSDGGTFEYREEFADRHAVWAGAVARGVWLKGYWRVMWQNEAVRVKGIDVGARTVTLAKAIHGGIGSKYHRPGGSGAEEYWAFNLLEEIDEPGEWAVDFVDRRLYLLPPEGVEGGIGNGEVLIADVAEPVVRVRGAGHVVLRGVTVEGSMGDGVVLKDATDSVVAGCVVRNVDGDGIVVDGGVRDVVMSNDLYDLGGGGIWLGGGDETAVPRVAAGHRAVNNHVHHFGQIRRVYAAGINAGFSGGGGGGHHAAVGMYVGHNLVHDTPHVGVLFGSFDSVFEFNEVFRYAMVSNDIGAFYSYDRVGRFGNITLRFNLMHSTPDGDGIYFDHDHPDMTVFGNIAVLRGTGKRGTGFLYKIGSQGTSGGDGGGQTIDCRNNVAVSCNTGFEFLAADVGKVRIENNVTVMCPVPERWRTVREGKGAEAKPYATGKNASYAADPGFVDLAGLRVALRGDSAVFRDLPGFVAIPVEKIGLYVDEYRTRLPTEEELDRAGRRVRRGGAGYEVMDR